MSRPCGFQGEGDLKAGWEEPEDSGKDPPAGGTSQRSGWERARHCGQASDTAGASHSRLGIWDGRTAKRILSGGVTSGGLPVSKLTLPAGGGCKSESEVN